MGAELAGRSWWSLSQWSSSLPSSCWPGYSPEPFPGPRSQLWRRVNPSRSRSFPGRRPGRSQVEMEEAQCRLCSRSWRTRFETKASADQLKAGTYALETGMAPGDVVAQLVSGPNTQADTIDRHHPRGPHHQREFSSPLPPKPGDSVTEFEAALAIGGTVGVTVSGQTPAPIRKGGSRGVGRVCSTRRPMSSAPTTEAAVILNDDGGRAGAPGRGSRLVTPR